MSVSVWTLRRRRLSLVSLCGCVAAALLSPPSPEAGAGTEPRPPRPRPGWRRGGSGSPSRRPLGRPRAPVPPASPGILSLAGADPGQAPLDEQAEARATWESSPALLPPDCD